MVEKAVSPSALTPGLYLTVNLISGAAGAQTGQLRILLVTAKASSGDLTVDSEIRESTGPEGAATAFGTGALGHLMAQQLYAAFPGAIVDYASPTAGAGAATTNVTFTGAPAENVAVGVRMAGREWELAWLFGESPDDIRDKLLTSVAERTETLPVSSAAGAAGVAAITAKDTGNVGNDIKIKCWLKTSSGTAGVTPSTLTNLTGGTTDPDYTTILAAAQGREYHVILMGLSNTDGELTSSSSNAERGITHIESNNSGLNASLQTLAYGTTQTLAAAITAAQARNVGYVQHVHGINFQSLPGEMAAYEIGDRVYRLGLDPAFNRIGNQLGTTVYGSEDKVADQPTNSESESAIGSGVSLLGYDASGNVITIRPITAYSLNSAGGPDRRLLDMQNTDATYIVARDIRTALPAEFPNAKIIEDLPPGVQDIPENVTEERDIRSFVISRMGAWVQAGVVLGSALETAITNSELIVEVDDQDPSQVNIVIPMTIVPPLAKFGVVVNRNPA